MGEKRLQTLAQGDWVNLWDGPEGALTEAMRRAARIILAAKHEKGAEATVEGTRYRYEPAEATLLRSGPEGRWEICPTDVNGYEHILWVAQHNLGDGFKANGNRYRWGLVPE